ACRADGEEGCRECESDEKCEASFHVRYPFRLLYPNELRPLNLLVAFDRTSMVRPGNTRGQWTGVNKVRKVVHTCLEETGMRTKNVVQKGRDNALRCFSGPGEPLAVAHLGRRDAQPFDRLPRAVRVPSGRLVEAARPRIVLEHP